MLQNGGLPGGFGVGTQRAGIAVAILDTDARSREATHYFRGASPPVTVTLGDALSVGDRRRALDTQRTLVHVATMSTLSCVPHTTIRHLGKEQSTERSLQTLSACHAMDVRDFEDTGAIPFAESVVGSIPAMRGFSHTLVSARHTGERSEDKHAIYHLPQFRPLIDRELAAHARSISQRSCGGRLRPVQHLGLDYIPVIKGVRSKEDPTKWLRKSWVCCDGDTYCIFGNLPDNVTRTDWCHAIGIDSKLVTALDQLRNALWPRLGALLSTQAVMYYMAHRFGFPVVEYTEAVEDAALMAWVQSLMLAPVWPRMPFQRAYLLLVPVSLPGTVVVDTAGHLLSVPIPKQTSTFKRDIASAFAAAYAPLSFPAQYLRFEGMVQIGADTGVVFKAEFVDDRSRSDLRANVLEIPQAKGQWPLHANAQVFSAVPMASYVAFLRESVQGGRTAWGVDALIIRDCADMHLSIEGAALCLGPGRFGFVPGHTRFVHPRYTSSDCGGVLLDTRIATSMLASGDGRSKYAQDEQHKEGERVLLQREEREMVRRHETQLGAALAGLQEADVTNLQWCPPVGVQVRVLQRPANTRFDRRRPTDFTLDRTYNSTAANQASRYDILRSDLGILGTSHVSVAADDKPEGPALVWYSGVRQAQLCVVLWRGYVVVQARGSRLSFLGHSSAYVSRVALESTTQRNTILNQQAPGGVRTLIRHVTRPFKPDAYDCLETLYRHQCVVKRYRAGKGSAEESAISSAFIEARRARTYPHQALEQALRELAKQRGAARTFSLAEWLKLQVDEPRLLMECIEVDGKFYTLNPIPLTHNTGIRELAAHGLSSAVQSWLDSPLDRLRHCGVETAYTSRWMADDTLGWTSLSVYFRRLRLACPKWQAVRAAQPRFHRVIRRLVDAGIDKASWHPPFATVASQVSVVGVAEQFAIRFEARYIELPQVVPAMPGTSVVPTILTASGVQVDRSQLRRDQVYLCKPAMFREHLVSTYRQRLSQVMDSLLQPRPQLKQALASRGQPSRLADVPAC